MVCEKLIADFLNMGFSISKDPFRTCLDRQGSKTHDLDSKRLHDLRLASNVGSRPYPPIAMVIRIRCSASCETF